MVLKEGYYDFMGNTVEYCEGEDYGFDLDSLEEIPVDVLMALGDFVKGFDE